MTDPKNHPDIVERRRRYIDRQRQMHPDTVNVRFRDARPEGSGPANRHGMPAVPVGQHLVKNWPVLDLGEQPAVALDEWKLEVGGLVHNPLTLNWEQFMALPQVEDTSDFHCVTTWSRLDNHWKGVRFRTLAELAVPQEAARFVLCTGYDFLPGSFIPYTVNVPLAREHGGPVRMITPKLYAWKGAKWIRKIEFLAEDRKGFWEERGYSNTAEPWFNDRYSY